MKMSQYNFVTTSFSENRYIAYNTFTGAYYEMDEDRLGELDALLEHVDGTARLPTRMTPFQTTLLEQGFVVDQDRDELAEVRARYFERLPETKGLSLTIAPTISCNFACGYCFQSHSKKRMGEAEVEQLVGFVEDKLPEGSHLAITWFGGEPLNAFATVQALALRLSALAAEKSCAFHHCMISNGFLLTEDKAKFLASVPTFDSVQITLDGLPEQHDKRRPTLAGKGTFERIVQNVVAAARHIRISIRVNVDKSNCASLNALLDRLAEEGIQERVFVYLGHVWDYTPEVEESPFLTIEEFAAVDAQFKLMKFGKGFHVGANLPKPRQGAQCVADHPNGYVVGPTGLLFKCWNEVHEDADKASGVLPEASCGQGGCGQGGCGSDKMQDNATTWKQYDPFSHTPCQTCKVAPLCMSGCPWESAKSSADEPGHCTALRFNLGDELRLYEMERRLKAVAEKSASEATRAAVG